MCATKKLGAPQKFFAPELARSASCAQFVQACFKLNNVTFLTQHCLLAMEEKWRKILVEGGETGVVLNYLSN